MRAGRDPRLTTHPRATVRLRVERWARTPRSPVRLGLPCTLPLQSVWHTQPLRTHLHEAAAVARVHTCTLPPPSLRYTPRACAAQRWSSRRPRAHSREHLHAPRHTHGLPLAPTLAQHTQHTLTSTDVPHMPRGSPQPGLPPRTGLRPEEADTAHAGQCGQRGRARSHLVPALSSWGGMLVTEVTDVCLVANRSAGPQAQREAAQMHRRAP